MVTVNTTTGLLTSQPVTPNFLSPLNFRFSLKRSPNLNFFVVRATIPGFSISVTEQTTPFRRIPLSGNKISFGDFSIVYRVDETFTNYLEMHDWITSLGHLEDFEDYKKLASAAKGTGKSTLSDGTLTVLDSSKNPRTEITIKDMFPIEMGSIWFNADAPTVVHVTNEVKFKFKSFEIKQLPY